MINILLGILTLISAVVLIIRYGIHSMQGASCMIILVLSGLFGIFGIPASALTTAIIRIIAPIALIALSRVQLKDDYNAYVEEALKKERRKACIVPIQRKQTDVSKEVSVVSYNPYLAS